MVITSFWDHSSQDVFADLAGTEPVSVPHCVLFNLLAGHSQEPPGTPSLLQTTKKEKLKYH